MGGNAKKNENHIFRFFWGGSKLLDKHEFLTDFFFVRKALENFQWFQSQCCRYLEGAPRVALYDGKKN